MRSSFFIAPALLTLFVVGAGAAEDRVLNLPADYRRSLELYLTADRVGSDQVISMFANDVVRDAARAGEPLPDGSILVGEIYSPKLDADGDPIESQIGRRVPGEFVAIVMMERRAEWADQYPDDLKVGGWEFEVFSPAGENLNRDTTACRECHQPLDQTEFTWSFDHIGGAN
ncbi:MAG: cytochrome P460 family protein [Paracoccaceae bacterium]